MPRVRTHLAITLVTAALGAAPAAAQEGGDIELQAFHPSVDSRGLITLNGSSTLGPKELSLGLVTSWGRGLLHLENGAVSYEVANMVSPTLVAAVGLPLGPLRAELGASLPFHIVQGDRDPDSDGGTPGDPNDDSRFGFSGQGLGSAAAHLKVQLFRRRGSGLAAVGSVFFPTASERGAWLGATGVRPQLLLAADHRVGRLTLTANAGFRYQPGGALSFRDDTAPAGEPQTMKEISVGSSIPFGAGLALALAPGKLDAVGEVFGAAPLEAKGYFPLEAVLGLKVYLARSSYLTLGGGTGLLRGEAGSPDLRAFIGIVFEPRPADRDGDGISDKRDACPDDPEDLDGFEDEDGCPELGDGSADDGDRTEVADRDGDGILDDADDCPDDPEDVDGFEDADGCPDTDNDGDGILDVDDLCPDDPEDFDKFEDKDGCPESDNDQDLIEDGDDACPRVDGQTRKETAENYNMVDDDDGCPDRGGPVIDAGGVIQVLEKIHFDFDSARIQRRSFAILDAVALTIRSNPEIARVEIQGHTDERGSDAYNLDLSQRRAEAVREYLIGKKVEASRLEARGYGETQPRKSGHNERAWRVNRRVEFVILDRREEN